MEVMPLGEHHGRVEGRRRRILIIIIMCVCVRVLTMEQSDQCRPSVRPSLSQKEEEETGRGGRVCVSVLFSFSSYSSFCFKIRNCGPLCTGGMTTFSASSASSNWSRRS